MNDKTKNLICSGVFFLFGAFLYFESLSIKVLMTKDLGSGFFPKVIAVSIMVMAIVELIITLTNKRIVKDEKTDRDIKGGLLTIMCMAAYIALYDPLGFLLSTALYLFVQILILSTEKNRRIPLFALISVASSVVIYVIFVYAISMPLPTGILSF